MKKKAGKQARKRETPEINARFAPVARAFEEVKGVREGKLFSKYGLKVNGKIFAMFGRAGFVVKLPKARVDELVGAGKAKRFEPGPGRVMKEWAAFRSGESEWVQLAREACGFVRQGKR